MLAAGFHALTGDRPDGGVGVDLGPAGAANLARAGGGQNQELEGQDEALVGARLALPGAVPLPPRRAASALRCSMRAPVFGSAAEMASPAGLSTR